MSTPVDVDAARTLLPLIEELDNLPYQLSAGGPPASHPIVGKRLIPLHATVKDFQARLPPVGLVPATLLRDLKQQKGLRFFSVMKKVDMEMLVKHSEAKGVSSQLMDVEVEPEPETEVASASEVLEGDDLEQGRAPGQADKEGEKAIATATAAVVEGGTRQGGQSSTQSSPKVEAVPQGEDQGSKTVGSKTKQAYKVIVLCVFFTDDVNARGVPARTEVMMSLARRWREQGLFPDRTKMWNDEPFPIYASPLSTVWSLVKDQDEWAKEKHKTPFGNVLFEFERCLTPVLGAASFGTHLTAYEGKGDQMRIWISRRHAERTAWPLKLDSTAAGGLSSGLTPLENVIKDAEEEAGLPEALVAKYARCTGVISYYQATAAGYVIACEYSYDVELPARDSAEYVQPRPDFEESEAFMLMSIPEILSALHAHEFKPLSALVTIDFLIRHGYVTPENEPNYFDIVRRCHRRSGLAGPGV